LEAKKFKSFAWLIAKAGISIAGLLWAYSKTDIPALRALLYSSNLIWLIPPVFLYIASKWVSALRLNLFFGYAGTTISLKQGVLLYWLGMFYNLFLPGGIGGDAYKVLLLNKHLKASWKKTTSAVLYDRITGMMALLFLSAVFMMYLQISEMFWLGLLMFLLLIPVYVLFTRFLFPDFMPGLWKGWLLSLAVQGLQVLAAWCIFIAIQKDQSITGQLLLFLISSVVAVLPLTIGGVGARELTFVYGAQWMDISPETGVGFSLLFFLISALVALPGMTVDESKLFGKITPPSD